MPIQFVWVKRKVAQHSPTFKELPQQQNTESSSENTTLSMFLVQQQIVKLRQTKSQNKVDTLSWNSGSCMLQVLIHYSILRRKQDLGHMYIQGSIFFLFFLCGVWGKGGRGPSIFYILDTHKMIRQKDRKNLQASLSTLHSSTE